MKADEIHEHYAASFEKLDEVVDYLYGSISALDEKYADYGDSYELIKTTAEIIDFEYTAVKQAVFEDYTALDMLRAEIEFKSRPDKKEVYELICEALGVNQFATKEEIKDLIDQL